MNPVHAASPNRLESRGNRRLLSKAPEAFSDALARAAVEGFFGEVCVRAVFQDGVVQTVIVERSQMLR